MDCTGLQSISIPNSVTIIRIRAFFGCTGLSSIIIPQSVSDIGMSVFSYCSAIRSVIVESGNSIYDSRENCQAIIESSTNKLLFGCINTTIPSSVVSIGENCFEGSSITSITIPENIKEIGSGAFYECLNLTSVSIPNTVTCIEGATFGNCSKLENITILINIKKLQLHGIQTSMLEWLLYHQKSHIMKSNIK